MAAQWADIYCPHFTGAEIEAEREYLKVYALRFKNGIILFCVLLSPP